MILGRRSPSGSRSLTIEPVTRRAALERALEEKPGMSTKTKTKVKPLADRILVRRLEETETSRGGIIIPDTAKEKPQQGQVIAVGPGKLNDEGNRVAPEVSVGDKILMSKYAGTEVKIEGEDFIIMREDDVLGVIAK